MTIWRNGGTNKEQTVLWKKEKWTVKIEHWLHTQQWGSFLHSDIIETKCHSQLTNEHLHMCVRMALTPFKPRFKILAGQAGAQFPHWVKKGGTWLKEWKKMIL